MMNSRWLLVVRRRGESYLLLGQGTRLRRRRSCNGSMLSTKIFLAIVRYINQEISNRNKIFRGRLGFDCLSLLIASRSYGEGKGYLILAFRDDCPSLAKDGIERQSLSQEDDNLKI